MARRRQRRDAQEPGWGRARAVLDRAIEETVEGSKGAVTSLRRLGRGLSREGYRAELALEPDGSDLVWVVLLPCHDAVPEYDRRAHKEAKLLARLADEDLGLNIPRLIALVDDGGRPALVVTAVFGTPLDLRAGRQVARPWETVARVAARVHGVDPERFRDLDGHPTRRHHAEAMLATFEGLDEPLVRDAHAWALEHLPPEVPSALIHGDLLGQNILLYPGEKVPGLIDWEYAGPGDPAYELAIVTRGVRRPFQDPDGMARLLDAYAESGGQEIREAEVRFYEVCLVGHFYRASLGPQGTYPHPPEQELKRLRGVLRRATTAPRAHPPAVPDPRLATG